MLYILFQSSNLICPVSEEASVVVIDKLLHLKQHELHMLAFYIIKGAVTVIALDPDI